MVKPQRNIFNALSYANVKGVSSSVLKQGSGAVPSVLSGGALGSAGLLPDGSVPSVLSGGGLGSAGLVGKGRGGGGSSGSAVSYNSLTPNQLKALQTIYDSYTELLANKQYEQITALNYQQYMEVLDLIKSVQIQDPNLNLFLSIAENSLVGTINVGTLYTSYAYNEIKVALLNKRIQEILSDKNTHNTATTVTGQFTATQTFTLSPIYSYYIYVYGLPEFGVGFDPVKLAFIKSLPQFTLAA